MPFSFLQKKKKAAVNEVLEVKTPITTVTAVSADRELSEKTKKEKDDKSKPPPVKAEKFESNHLVERKHFCMHGEGKIWFSGAPQFLVEQEDDGRHLPQVFFPWGKHLDVSGLTDANHMEHESFTSATLHAHLPIPPRDPESIHSQSNHSPKPPGKRRPAYGIGTYEVPNMLDFEGKELGTIGMKHFLEIPIRDSLVTPESVKKQATNSNRKAQLARLTSSEAMKVMAHDGAFSHKEWYERHEMAHDRKAWKEIGLRDVSVAKVKSRAEVLTAWYNNMAENGWQKTLLDETDVRSLHEDLFSYLLYPSPKVQNTLVRNMTQQIEALVRILSIPGAWLDFSLVESRILFGKIIWEFPPNHENDPSHDPGAEIHWLLIQTLLSIELALRLDASLRDPRIHHTEDSLTPEIQRYIALKTRKIDWDIIMARVFLDNVYLESHNKAFPETCMSLQKRPDSGNFFSKWKLTLDARAQAEKDGSPWDCVIFPRRHDMHADGLMAFAEALHWPNIQNLEKEIAERLDRFNTACSFAEKAPFLRPTEDLSRTSSFAMDGHQGETQSPVLETPKAIHTHEFEVTLTPARETHSGSFLSKMWFGGLVLPGESISHLLISALFEHDSDAVDAIGAHPEFYGGFVSEGRSWWSHFCIVGKVTAPLEGGTQSMGWINTPKVLPIDQNNKPMHNGWIKVRSQGVPPVGESPRILHGESIMADTFPLGLVRYGKDSLHKFSFLKESPSNNEEEATFEHIKLRPDSTAGFWASIAFTLQSSSLKEPLKVDWELLYNVCIVSAYSCQVSSILTSIPDPSEKPLPEEYKQLHSENPHEHPLHDRFNFVVKSLSDIVKESVGQSTYQTDWAKKKEVCIIDARGSRANEVLARAWCSKVGEHALISKVGRTCLSCSIREAIALDIRIVIRIGHLLKE